MREAAGAGALGPDEEKGGLLAEAGSENGGAHALDAAAQANGGGESPRRSGREVEVVNPNGIFHCLFNVTSVTGIVFVNKLVFATGFKFPVVLTLWHIAMTAAGMRVFRWAGFFEHHRLDVRTVAPLAIAYNGYVILSNASLAYNSVGFYQISKILNTPCLMLIERVAYGKQSTLPVKLAVLTMSVGIGLATVTDASVTQIGLLVAAASIVCTSVYQILIGRKQKELGVGSMQLLHEKAPVAAAMLTFAVPFLEPTGVFDGAAAADTQPRTLMSWFRDEADATKLAIIFLSGVMGLLVNWSMFLTIKVRRPPPPRPNREPPPEPTPDCPGPARPEPRARAQSTSALTFNVVGHIKTFFIIGGGVLFFGDFISVQKALSLLLAFSGIGWYSYLKLNMSGSDK